jgi:hypothetical protein
LSELGVQAGCTGGSWLDPSSSTKLIARPDRPGRRTAFPRLHRNNGRLRATNQDLAEHLELAVANIQRLTLEHQQLPHQLEAAINVTRLAATAGTAHLRPQWT